MPNVVDIFEKLTDNKFNEECLTLLNKIMSISSPMDFDDEFASEEELDLLISEMDRFNLISTRINLLRKAIDLAKPCESSDVVFI